MDKKTGHDLFYEWVEAQKAAGIKQWFLADKLGVSQEQFSRWKTGAMEPGKMARAFIAAHTDGAVPATMEWR